MPHAAPLPEDRSSYVRIRLTPKDDTFFDYFADLAGHLVSGAQELTNILGKVNGDDRRSNAERMKALENRADESTHAIMNKVNSSFITPFDREDIYSLASSLDDCMDHMEAAVSMVDLYQVAELPPQVAEQVEALGTMAELTAAAMPRLKGMRDLREYWIEINRLENVCDESYRELQADLFNDGKHPVLDIIKIKAVIDELEDAADAFETVANTVESIAVKES